MADQPTNKGRSAKPSKPSGNAQLRAELAAKDQQLATRFKEIAALTALLRAEEEKNAKLRTEIGWIAGLLRKISDRPRWWSLLPGGKRRERERELLRRSGLFDPASYMELHPDVAQSGAEALDHYLLHGLLEGRSRVPHSDEGMNVAR
jgi:flagellar motor protein MotB